MIIILETDIRKHNGKIFSFKGSFFKSRWRGKTAWRVMWGLWSISYYPEKGLKDFFDHAKKILNGGINRWVILKN